MIGILIPFIKKTNSADASYPVESIKLEDQIKDLSDNLNESKNEEIVNQGVYAFGEVGNNNKQVETITAEPAITPTPQIIYETVIKREFIPVIEGVELKRWRYSYYYPPLGGVNCRTFEEGVCKSPMASGDNWEDWLGKAVACDSQIPLGSKLVIVAPEEVKGIWYCLDRGGGIEGTDLLDFLTDHQDLEWLTYVYGYIME